MKTFPEQIVARGDTRFYVSDEGDLYVLREMYEMNVYQVEIVPGMKVLDIGAHKGIFSVWAAKQGAEVTAYEPGPDTYQVLLRNLALNGVDVEARNLGVWSGRNTLTFYRDPENSIGSSFYQRRVGSVAECQVSVESFDEVLGSSEWDLVKIDAEEAEYEMLLSSNRLGQIKYLTLEWHCPTGQKDCPELYRTVDKLKQFFDVPPVDLTWRVLSMKRK
jgi:FkbM family methyltransferase